VWRWPTTIEQLLTHPAGFGLSTATNCQRAWCRILDGEPLGDLWRDARVQKMLRGGEQQEEAPYEVVGVAGIRTAKSMIGACFCAIRARYADMSRIRPGENPPILPVTSVRTLNAKAIVGHCGGLLSRSNFSGWLAKKPTSEEVWIKHYETGAPIKVMVIAGSSGASNLTSYWHASVVVDEAFKLPSEKDDAKVNLEDVRRNITGRVLPHGQVLYEGSPWHAQGPAYELIEEYEGKPSRECVVLRTNGPDMNPILWTPEEMERMAASKDQAIRDALTMGGLGIFLSDIQGASQRLHDPSLHTAASESARASAGAIPAVLGCDRPRHSAQCMAAHHLPQTREETGSGRGARVDPELVEATQHARGARRDTSARVSVRYYYGVH
jgi:hypothetical protein